VVRQTDRVREEDLRAVAFGGADCGESALCAAAGRGGDARSRLLAAVALGARGRYGVAATALGELIHGRDSLTAGLAGATLAAHRRQLGGHAVARGLDAAALRRVLPLLDGATAPADPDGLDVAGAVVDGLLGLAADNLGVGRLSAAARFVRHAGGVAAGWRGAVRAGWVRAELALAGGDAAAAVEPAERAAAVARQSRAPRHLVKSDLVLAAALLAAGTPAGRSRAGELVASATARARSLGLRSLVWPAELLAANLEPAGAGRHRTRVTHELHALLPLVDPQGRRSAAASPWVPA
jgi:hypothetical protein